MMALNSMLHFMFDRMWRVKMSVFMYLLLLLCCSCSLSLSISAYLHHDPIASSKFTKNQIKMNSSACSVPEKSNQCLNKTYILKKAASRAFKGGMYGAVAGSFQVISLMWLRTVVNYQYRYGVSMTEAMDRLYKEGGVPRFYRGVVFALIQNPLAKFGSVASNEGSKALLEITMGEVSPMLSSILGTLLSIVWRVIIMPLETVKTILQVDGSIGFDKMMVKLRNGDIGILFEGSAATILSTFFSHYPWFYTYNYLDRVISRPRPDQHQKLLIRSAFIGFVASAVSDVVSNVMRIIKTVKQAMSVFSDAYSYADIVAKIYSEGGIAALFGRGLATRLVANGLQSVMFTVVWRCLPLYVKQFKERRKQSINGDNGSNIST